MTGGAGRAATLSLADGMRELGMTPERLWAGYLALGGSHSLAEVQHHVASGECPDDHEHNVIAQALNEAFVAVGQDHPVAYRHLHRLEESDDS